MFSVSAQIKLKFKAIYKEIQSFCVNPAMA